MAFWQGWDPRSIIFFVVILAVSEFLIQLRWRTSLLCRACGFDPVLYVKEPQKAAAKVKMHLDKRKEDPKYLMTRPLNLPTISAEKAEAFENKDKKGRLVSRQV